MDRLEQSIHELVMSCKSMYQSGLQRANGGNVSVRVDAQDQMLVEARGTSFKQADKKNFVLADFDGNKIEGEMEPTKEGIMHGYIYRQREEVNAIVHVHAPYAVAWSAYHDLLGQETWQAKIKFGYDIPVVDVQSPIVRKEDLPQLKKVLVCDVPVSGFILKNHGIVALGKTIEKAEEIAELIEETAKIAVLKCLMESRQEDL